MPVELHVGSMGGPKRLLTNALNPQIRREDLVIPTGTVQVVRRPGIPGLLYKPYQTSRKLPALVNVHGGRAARQ